MLILQVHVIDSSLKKEVYNPKAVIPHAVLLRQAFAHCGKFLTAASRRSLDRVSVPVCLIVLSNQILIVALVSHYLTNKLISRKLLSRRKNPFHSKAYGVLAAVSSCCPPPKGKFLRVTHPSATWVKNSRTTCMYKASRQRSSWARIKLSLNFHKFIFIDFFLKVCVLKLNYILLRN